MPSHLSTLWDSPMRVGLMMGLAYGLWDLLYTYLLPLAEDSPRALLFFYGPMFTVWAVMAFRAVRRSGRWFSGVKAGATAAFFTFLVFDPLVIVRVNLFLQELTSRADWQNLMLRFHRSGMESLRAFVTLDYIKGAPLKIAVASIVGALMGVLGASLGSIPRRPAHAVHQRAN